MDGTDIVLYHFRTFKQKENMVPESRNIVTHPFGFSSIAIISRLSLLIVEKDYILHDRKSCFLLLGKMIIFFFNYK